jgi:predicted  nucleic acid-binding Zn ribbon protein
LQPHLWCKIKLEGLGKMFNVDIAFRYYGKPDEKAISDGVYGLLSGWVRNGQVLDSDWAITFTEKNCHAVVSCPEETSLNARYANKDVRKAISDLQSRGLQKPEIQVLGNAIETATADRCRHPKWYFLATNFLSCESALRCGDDGLPVPLYRIGEPTDALVGNYQDILTWQRTYRDCDELQIMCGVGEHFATRQMSDAKSPLSVMGRDICRRIEDITGVPTYYELYRGEGRSQMSERRRLCPECGGKWLLESPVLKLIDFKCERCRLISNIAWSVRT